VLTSRAEIAGYAIHPRVSTIHTIYGAYSQAVSSVT